MIRKQPPTLDKGRQAMSSETNITRKVLLAILSDMSATATYANRHMC